MVGGKAYLDNIRTQCTATNITEVQNKITAINADPLMANNKLTAMSADQVFSAIMVGGKTYLDNIRNALVDDKGMVLGSDAMRPTQRKVLAEKMMEAIGKPFQKELANGTLTLRRTDKVEEKNGALYVTAGGYERLQAVDVPQSTVYDDFSGESTIIPAHKEQRWMSTALVTLPGTGMTVAVDSATNKVLGSNQELRELGKKMLGARLENIGATMGDTLKAAGIDASKGLFEGGKSFSALKEAMGTIASYDRTMGQAGVVCVSDKEFGTLTYADILQKAGMSSTGFDSLKKAGNGNLIDGMKAVIGVVDSFAAWSKLDGVSTGNKVVLAGRMATAIGEGKDFSGKVQVFGKVAELSASKDGISLALGKKDTEFVLGKKMETELNTTAGSFTASLTNEKVIFKLVGDGKLQVVGDVVWSAIDDRSGIDVGAAYTLKSGAIVGFGENGQLKISSGIMELHGLWGLEVSGRSVKIAEGARGPGGEKADTSKIRSVELSESGGKLYMHTGQIYSNGKSTGYRHSSVEVGISDDSPVASEGMLIRYNAGKDATVSVGRFLVHGGQTIVLTKLRDDGAHGVEAFTFSYYLDMVEGAALPLARQGGAASKEKYVELKGLADSGYISAADTGIKWMQKELTAIKATNASEGLKDRAIEAGVAKGEDRATLTKLFKSSFTQLLTNGTEEYTGALADAMMENDTISSLAEAVSTASYMADTFGKRVSDAEAQRMMKEFGAASGLNISAIMRADGIGALSIAIFDRIVNSDTVESLAQSQRAKMATFYEAHLDAAGNEVRGTRISAWEAWGEKAAIYTAAAIVTVAGFIFAAGTGGTSAAAGVSAGAALISMVKAGVVIAVIAGTAHVAMTAHENKMLGKAWNEGLTIKDVAVAAGKGFLDGFAFAGAAFGLARLPLVSGLSGWISASYAAAPLATTTKMALYGGLIYAGGNALVTMVSNAANGVNLFDGMSLKGVAGDFVKGAAIALALVWGARMGATAKGLTTEIAAKENISLGRAMVDGLKELAGSFRAWGGGALIGGTGFLVGDAIAGNIRYGGDALKSFMSGAAWGGITAYAFTAGGLKKLALAQERLGKHFVEGTLWKAMATGSVKWVPVSLAFNVIGGMLSGFVNAVSTGKWSVAGIFRTAGGNFLFSKAGYNELMVSAIDGFKNGAYMSVMVNLFGPVLTAQQQAAHATQGAMAKTVAFLIGQFPMVLKVSAINAFFGMFKQEGASGAGLSEGGLEVLSWAVLFALPARLSNMFSSAKDRYVAAKEMSGVKSAAGKEMEGEGFKKMADRVAYQQGCAMVKNTAEYREARANGEGAKYLKENRAKITELGRTSTFYKAWECRARVETGMLSLKLSVSEGARKLMIETLMKESGLNNIEKLMSAVCDKASLSPIMLMSKTELAKLMLMTPAQMERHTAMGTLAQSIAQGVAPSRRSDEMKALMKSLTPQERQVVQSMANAIRASIAAARETGASEKNGFSPRQLTALSVSLGKAIAVYSATGSVSKAQADLAKNPLITALACGEGKTMPIWTLQTGLVDYVFRTGGKAAAEGLKLAVLTNTSQNAKKDYYGSDNVGRQGLVNYLNQKGIDLKVRPDGAKISGPGIYVFSAKTLMETFYSEKGQRQLKGFNLLTIDEAESVFASVRLTYSAMIDVVKDMGSGELSTNKAFYELASQVQRSGERLYTDKDRRPGGSNAAYEKDQTTGETRLKGSAARQLMNDVLGNNANAHLVEALGGKDNARILLSNFINKGADIWTRAEGDGMRSSSGRNALGGYKAYKGYDLLDSSGSLMKDTKMGDPLKSMAAAIRYGANAEQSINAMHTCAAGGVSIFQAVDHMDKNSAHRGKSIVVGFAGTVAQMTGIMGAMRATFLNLSQSTFEKSIGQLRTFYGEAATMNAAVKEVKASHTLAQKAQGWIGKVLTVVGMLDRGSALDTGRAIAREYAGRDGRVVEHSYEKSGVTVFRAVDANGKEVQRVAVYNDANSYRGSFNRYCQAGRPGQGVFGRSIHIIAEYVTGANAGAVAEGVESLSFKNRAGKITASQFTRVLFSTIGTLNSSDAIQQASRYNVSVEGQLRRATTIRFNEDGTVVHGASAINHYIDVTRLQATGAELKTLTETMRTNPEGANALVRTYMDRANETVNSRQLAEYHTVVKTEAAADSGFTTAPIVAGLSAKAAGVVGDITRTAGFFDSDVGAISAINAGIAGQDAAVQKEVVKAFNPSITVAGLKLVAGVYTMIGPGSGATFAEVNEAIGGGEKGLERFVAFVEAKNPGMAAKLAGIKAAFSDGTLGASHVEALMTMMGMTFDESAIAKQLADAVVNGSGEFRVDSEGNVGTGTGAAIRDGRVEGLSLFIRVANMIGVGRQRSIAQRVEQVMVKGMSIAAERGAGGVSAAVARIRQATPANATDAAVLANVRTEAVRVQTLLGTPNVPAGELREAVTRLEQAVEKLADTTRNAVAPSVTILVSALNHAAGVLAEAPMAKVGQAIVNDAAGKIIGAAADQANRTTPAAATAVDNVSAAAAEAQALLRAPGTSAEVLKQAVTKLENTARELGTAAGIKAEVRTAVAQSVNTLIRALTHAAGVLAEAPMVQVGQAVVNDAAGKIIGAAADQANRTTPAAATAVDNVSAAAAEAQALLRAPGTSAEVLKQAVTKLENAARELGTAAGIKAEVRTAVAQSVNTLIRALTHAARVLAEAPMVQVGQGVVSEALAGIRQATPANDADAAVLADVRTEAVGVQTLLGTPNVPARELREAVTRLEQAVSKLGEATRNAVAPSVKILITALIDTAGARAQPMTITQAMDVLNASGKASTNEAGALVAAMVMAVSAHMASGNFFGARRILRQLAVTGSEAMKAGLSQLQLSDFNAAVAAIDATLTGAINAMNYQQADFVVGKLVDSGRMKFVSTAARQAYVEKLAYSANQGIAHKGDVFRFNKTDITVQPHEDGMQLVDIIASRIRNEGPAYERVGSYDTPEAQAQAIRVLRNAVEKLGGVLAFEVNSIMTDMGPAKFARAIINIDLATGAVGDMGATSLMSAGANVTGMVHNHTFVSNDPRVFLGDFAAMKAARLNESIVLERGADGQIAGIKRLSFDSNDNPVIENIHMVTGKVIDSVQMGSKTQVEEHVNNINRLVSGVMAAVGEQGAVEFTRKHEVAGVRAAEAPRSVGAARAGEAAEAPTMAGPAGALVEALNDAGNAIETAGAADAAATVRGLANAALQIQGVLDLLTSLGADAQLVNLINASLAKAAAQAGDLASLAAQGNAPDKIAAAAKAIAELISGAIADIVKAAAAVLPGSDTGALEQRAAEIINQAGQPGWNISGIMDSMGIILGNVSALLEAAAHKQGMDDRLRKLTVRLADESVPPATVPVIPGGMQSPMSNMLAPGASAGQAYPMLDGNNAARKVFDLVAGERLADRAAATKIVAIDMSLTGSHVWANYLSAIGVKVVRITENMSASQVHTAMESLGQQAKNANYFVLLNAKSDRLAREFREQAFENVMVAIKSDNVSWQSALSGYVDYLEKVHDTKGVINAYGIKKLQEDVQVDAATGAVSKDTDENFQSAFESELSY
jgi:hypothetical protein